MRRKPIHNPRYPHTVRISRLVVGKGGESNPFADADAPLRDTEDVLYAGEGRSYTDTTTQGNTVVDENRRKATVPVRYDVWEAGRKPTDGDAIRVTIGNNMEEGIVYDCEGDNDHSIVYWKLRRT